MAYYCVSFRIANKTIGDQTYEDRRQALIRNVRTEGLGFWDEPTSFIMAESNLDTPSFAARARKGLSEKEDLLFVFDPADMSAAYFGAVARADVLRSFFPRLQKQA